MGGLRASDTALGVCLLSDFSHVPWSACFNPLDSPSVPSCRVAGFRCGIQTVSPFWHPLHRSLTFPSSPACVV